MHTFLYLYVFFQVAVMRSDGTKYDGFYDRQLVVTVSPESTGTTNPIPEDKRIIPDSNILDYEIVPGENDRIIRVTVSKTCSLICTVSQ